MWRALIDGDREHQGLGSRLCRVPPGDVRRAAERAEDKRREREAIAGAARAAAAEARGAAECADAARREGDAVEVAAGAAAEAVAREAVERVDAARRGEDKRRERDAIGGAAVAAAAAGAEGGVRRVRARLSRAPAATGATLARLGAARVAASRSGQCVSAGQLPPEMWCLVAECLKIKKWGRGELDFVCTTILQGVLMRRKVRDKRKRKGYRDKRRMNQAAKAYALGLGRNHRAPNVDVGRVQQWTVLKRDFLSNARVKRAQRNRKAYRDAKPWPKWIY